MAELMWDVVIPFISREKAEEVAAELPWLCQVVPCVGHPHPLTPSADLPACRDEDPATPATLAAAYPDPPEYQHPEDDQ